MIRAVSNMKLVASFHRQYRKLLVWAIQRALNKNQAQEGRCVAAIRA